MMTLFVASTVTGIGSAIILSWAVLRVRHKLTIFAFAALALIASLLANPLVRFFAFAKRAEAAREQMLAEARNVHCVGQPASWLRAKYGPPAEVAKVGKTEHWWYTPGPAYYVHEDYVGLEVENGHIVSAYMQIN